MKKFVPVTCCAILFALLMGGYVTTAFAARSWEFVYQNDENGNAVSGNLVDLISAIDDGAEVRMVSCLDSTSGDYFAGWNFTYVAVNHIPDNVTAVQFLNEATLDASTNLWHVVNMRKTFRTDGIVAYQIDGQPQASTTSRRCMKWYVNR